MRSISEYFRDKTVLLTGATGFLGKSLVAKILTDLPDIAKLYLLIRSRKTPSGVVISAADRLKNELLTSSVFENLRKQHGDGFTTWAQGKVEALEGDSSEAQFGLPDDLYGTVCGEVQVLINGAALVKFDPPIDQSLKNNTLSAKHAVDFANDCHNAVFIHVSTAFVCGFRSGLVPEEIYQPLIDDPPAANGKMKVVPLELAAEIAEVTRLTADVRSEARQPHRHRRFTAEASKMMREGNGKMRDSLEEQIDSVRSQWVDRKLVALGLERAKMHGWIDTYTNMKALGEQMVVRERGDLPTAIIRPSIIESSLKDPAPGWLDGLRMIDPLIVAYGRRQLPDFPGSPDALVDLVPVDMVVNALLASIPTAHRNSGVTVYQLATSNDNPLTLREF
ncbi:MAG: SDR family oxidoreductase, partial [Candidatus Marinimicrobia bacterium]|nr:SDR family oxidoreductase [Candidatus Neomarinimicrobiota bacterium]